MKLLSWLLTPVRARCFHCARVPQSGASGKVLGRAIKTRGAARRNLEPRETRLSPPASRLGNLACLREV
jgi:hypothetical protein